MYDVVIRGGNVIDGTGVPGFVADVAIEGGQIAAVGSVTEQGREEIEADGLTVTPGFIDIHTHYDGQVIWDPMVSPSSSHGVSTVIMGNCGVGFAPVRAEQRDWAVGLMEGVEQIAATALNAGLQWCWESFPDYLDFIGSRSLAIDVGTHLPHGPLRMFVMGERSINEEATDRELDEMCRLVSEGMDAGAFGVSTSRLLAHRGTDGVVVPGTFAPEKELFALGRAMARSGHGVFEVAPAGAAGTTFGESVEVVAEEVSWMRRLAAEIGQTVMFALIDPPGWPPGYFDHLFGLAVDAWEAGVPLRAMSGVRAPGLVMGLEISHPFDDLPAYQSIAHLSFAERVARMRDPGLRALLVSDAQSAPVSFMRSNPEEMFVMDGRPLADLTSENSIEGIARREGRDRWEVFYDALMGDAGTAKVMLLKNRTPYEKMMAHPASVFGLADGGAHMTALCDSSAPTVMLLNGIPDSSGKSLYPLEWTVQKQTGDQSRLYGLADRGVLAPGKRADVNIIDLDQLSLRRPEVVYDLPGGGNAPRLVQYADGYVATMVKGQFVTRDGKDTGARPGALVRSGH